MNLDTLAPHTEITSFNALPQLEDSEVISRCVYVAQCSAQVTRFACPHDPTVPHV